MESSVGGWMIETVYYLLFTTISKLKGGRMANEWRWDWFEASHLFCCCVHKLWQFGAFYCKMQHLIIISVRVRVIVNVNIFGVLVNFCSSYSITTLNIIIISSDFTSYYYIFVLYMRWNCKSLKSQGDYYYYDVYFSRFEFGIQKLQSLILLTFDFWLTTSEFSRFLVKFS